MLFRGAEDNSKDPLEVKVIEPESLQKSLPKGVRKIHHDSVNPADYAKVFFDGKPLSLFNGWRSNTVKSCDGHFEAYAQEFAMLRGAVVDRKYCVSSMKGGEFLEDVRLQKEDVEYYRFLPGCFQLPCALTKQVTFNKKNHLNAYMSSMQSKDYKLSVQLEMDFAIAVTRYEYANLYHTMTDWYNAFLIMQFFNRTASETNVIVVDAHPRGVLDPVWPVLFNRTVRLSRLPQRTLVHNLAWGIMGYNSLLLRHGVGEQLPLSEEFRTFFLGRFGVPPHPDPLDCSRVRVLFIWRRDYVAHPRRPDGGVVRKIQNERELLNHLQSKYKVLSVKGVQIDQFEMRDQLRMMASTDLLIGMHGAGLTHALFIPRHSGLIELYPNYWSSANVHFRSIARWRGLQYEMWENRDPKLERSNHFTTVPVGVLDSLVKSVYKGMCHSSL